MFPTPSASTPDFPKGVLNWSRGEEIDKNFRGKNNINPTGDETEMPIGDKNNNIQGVDDQGQYFNAINNQGMDDNICPEAHEGLDDDRSGRPMNGSLNGNLDQDTDRRDIDDFETQNPHIPSIYMFPEENQNPAPALGEVKAGGKKSNHAPTNKVVVHKENGPPFSADMENCKNRKSKNSSSEFE